MLQSYGFCFSFQHTQSHIPRCQLAAIIGFERREEIPVLPAGRFLCGNAQYAPADHLFFIIASAFFQSKDTAFRKVLKNRAVPNIRGNRGEKRMRICRSFPFSQCSKIKLVCLFVRVGNILQLITERMRRKSTGAAAGFLRHRDQNFGFLLIDFARG